MHKAKETLQIIVEGERLSLTKGELVRLTDLQAAWLEAAGYVERAKGETAAPETPEAKAQAKTETRPAKDK